MNRNLNIEESLKRSGINPGTRVKCAVLAKYAEQYGRERREATDAFGFWRRRVPLYAAAAFALVVAGLSFVGGQKLSQPEQSAARDAIHVQDSLANAEIERSWHYAPRDVL